MNVVRYCLGLLLWLAAVCQAQSVLIVATSPVPQGKLTLLREIGQQQGLQVQAELVEKLSPQALPGLFAGRDLVIFDAGREHMQAVVRGRLAPALPGLKAPHIWMRDDAPQAQGLPPALAQRLHAYFVNGGRANFENFFRTLNAHFAGRSADGIAPPFVFPEMAVYYPRAPQQIFASPADYLRWRGIEPAKRPPTVAIAFHQQYLGAEMMTQIDDLIRRIEAGGGLALPYYAGVMGPHASMLTVNGQRVADVVINTQIVLDPEGRRKELAALGIPVLQSLAYRKGDVADWRADPLGLALMDVPFYLAQAEYTGIIDPMVTHASNKLDGSIAVIDEQSQALVNKALNLVRLQRLPNADKRLAVLFWNYPPGEKNLSASYLNLPRSFVSTLQALQAAGYQTRPQDEDWLVSRLQRLLAPFYRDGQLAGLLRDDLAERLPVKTYRAWLKQLPPAVQAELQQRWGDPEKSAMVLRDGGEPVFVIPRLAIGQVIFSPQAPRGEKWEDKEKALYHSTTAAPSHFYLAQYLWLRAGYQSDAIIHYGTHGSQEWLPGKERGLSVNDYPLLAVGDVPVIYPYIVDNIGEALQTKRRGRAVTVTHQTPPFAPAGLHQRLTEIHDLLHAWLAQDEGAVKQQQAQALRSKVRAERIDLDMGWDDARINADMRGFVNALHDHLHELAQTAQPMGLHSFGNAPQQAHRIGTVLMMLGQPFWEAAAKAAGQPDSELDEALIADYAKLADTPPWKLLSGYLDGSLPAPRDAALANLLVQGKRWYDELGAAGELQGLLSALAGEHRPTSYGGDPMKNPDALPTGRNLYGFDPSRVPTKAAWQAGKEAAEALIAAHRAKTGKAPKKLAFSLWSVETMRHYGLLEAQALWAMGVEPVWDAGGRVVDVKLVPRSALQRPRVDVVLSATGLYRDHFPNVMKQLAKAVELAARAQEQDNPLYANSQALQRKLQAQGIAPEAAQRAAETRIFSSASGRYGTGLDDAALATDTWKNQAEGDRKLASLYLSKMQFAYGSDEASWGSQGIAGAGGKAAQINLYAEHLKGTEGAVLSRTSNLYGMLTTDDPFQYLGGIGAAVRMLDGKAPELYISNLRGSGAGKVEGAAAFLAKELATRNFHPGYIKGLMAEGYSGTLQVLDSVNNFSGWTTVSREIVRDDQWQEFVEVYVRDKHKLGLKQWFAQNNPHALAQSIERMLEMARHGYWQTDADTLKELKQTYRQLAQQHDVRSDNQAFNQFVAAGYGLAGSLPALPAQARNTAASQRASQQSQMLEPTPVPPPIRGMRLEKVQNPPPAAPLPLALAGGYLLLGMSFGGGMLAARRHARGE